MENSRIFNKTITNLDIDSIKESSSSLLTFFGKKSKKELASFVLYKSDLVVCLSDSTIIIYDIIRESQILEINEISKRNKIMLQMEIILNLNEKFPYDYIGCLCEKNLYLINFENYEVKLEIELSHSTNRFFINYTDGNYKVLTLSKYNLDIYELNYSVNEDKLISTKIFDIKCQEIITNSNIFFKDNILFFESKTKLNIYKCDFNKLSNRNYQILKKDSVIFKNDNKSNDSEALKDLKINLSKMTNLFYLTTNNKIFLIKNSYSEIFLEEFEIVEKITKPSVITQIIMQDPFLFLLIENKVYIHFILDLIKPIEVVTLDFALTNYNFNLRLIKDTGLLQKIQKLNYVTNLIQYRDQIHLNRLKFIPQSDFDFNLNSCQFLITFYNYKNYKLEWLYLTKLSLQIRILKSVNPQFAFKLLSFHNQENKNLDTQSDLRLSNQKLFLKMNLESFCHTISSQDYSKAKTSLEDSEIELTFLLNLLINFFYSKNLVLLIYYINRLNIEHFYKFSQLSNSDKNIETSNDLEEIYSNFNSVLIKNDLELSNFLKCFFNKFITYRNELKLNLDKEERKKINIDNILEVIESVKNEINNDDDKQFSLIKNNFYTLEAKFKNENISEVQLKYVLIENVVFLGHLYSYKFSKNIKYTDNLKLMIKTSYNLFHKDLINLLKEFDLEEEFLLFHYYKGNYTKCITNIVNIYENLSKNSSESQEENENLNKLRSKWLGRYINLVSLMGEKLNQMEFYEYLKWALSKNSFLTIETLMEINKISRENLDLDFINLLKLFGIDPVIFYIKKFLKNKDACNALHHNEMINLYTIKIKLLQEAIEKEAGSNNNNSNQNEFYKWNKKLISKCLIILGTREEFCFFLIEQQMYNFEFAIEKIKTIPILEMELGIVLIKQDKFEEGVFKSFYSDFSSKLKIFKKLFKTIPIYDLTYLIFKYIVSKYHKNPKELKRILNCPEETFSIEEIVVELLENISNETDLIIVFSYLF